MKSILHYILVCASHNRKTSC